MEGFTEILHFMTPEKGFLSKGMEVKIHYFIYFFFFSTP